MPAGWMARKLDSLGGAVVAAVGGGGASQWREFVQQYLQRLGGHLDEAVRNLEHLQDLHAVADPTQKATLAGMVADSQTRAEGLAEALRAIAGADAILQPVAFIRHVDPRIAEATLGTFQPALPLDTVSLIWAGVGMVLALVMYELVKETLWAPVAIGKGMARRRRRRAVRPPTNRVEPRL